MTCFHMASSQIDAIMVLAWLFHNKRIKPSRSWRFSCSSCCCCYCCCLLLLCKPNLKPRLRYSQHHKASSRPPSLRHTTELQHCGGRPRQRTQQDLKLSYHETARVYPAFKHLERLLVDLFSQKSILLAIIMLYFSETRMLNYLKERERDRERVVIWLCIRLIVPVF
jgi:hypothetical protein